MVKQTHSTDLLQSSLAYQFAAPDLYRNQQIPTTKPISTRIGKVKKDGSREIVNCVEVSEIGRAELLMGLDSVPFCNDLTEPDSPSWIQQAVFYSDKIVVYPKRLEKPNTPMADDPRHKNLSRGIYNGFISSGSGKLVRKRLEAWIKSVQINKRLHSGKFRPFHSHIGFLTLTLPSDQAHGDNEIKRKCLMPFIQQLKRIYGVQEYFWAAEPQRNGNVHFHLLIDRWVDKDKVNDLWNVAADHLGYLSKYVSKSGDVRPPSTKIMACPKDMSLVKYVMKYVSKQPEVRCSLREKEGKKIKRISYWETKIDSSGQVECYERRPIEGRSWGMSKGITQVTVHSQAVSYRIRDLITVLQWDSSVHMIQSDFCEVYYCNTFDQLMRNDAVLLADYRKHYVKLYAELYRKVDQPEIKVIPLPQVEAPPIKIDPEFRQGRMFVSA